MKYLTLVLIVTIALLLSVFGVQNPGLVTVRFWWWQSVAMPLYSIILVAMMVGGLLSGLLGLPAYIQRRRELRRLRRRTVESQQNSSRAPGQNAPPIMHPLPDELVAGSDGARSVTSYGPPSATIDR